MPFHTIPHCSGTGQVFQAFHSVPPLRSTVEHLPLLQMGVVVAVARWWLQLQGGRCGCRVVAVVAGWLLWQGGAGGCRVVMVMVVGWLLSLTLWRWSRGGGLLLASSFIRKHVHVCTLQPERER